MARDPRLHRRSIFNLICKLKQATPLFSIEALKALTKLHATATPIECLTTAIEAVKKGVLFRKHVQLTVYSNNTKILFISIPASSLQV
jgi:hypothetical protein